MADKESLDNLIEGLAGAVVEAQNRIETHQIKNFLSFFDRDSRPKTIDITLPSLHPDKKDQDSYYRVPLLPLVSSSLLRIKEVEISFDTDLIGISETDEESEGQGKPEKLAPGNEAPKKLKSINLDIRSGGAFRKKTGTAHVVMKVEGRDISEGMARLLDRLLQTQGDVN